MRIGFVIQRYGDEFVGGAEKYVLSMAVGLAGEGHDVSVLTSCATSYADWADVHPPGTRIEHGVEVIRAPVRAPRDNDRFVPLHLRAVDPVDVPLWPWAQDRWSQTMGPDLVDGEVAVADLARRCDVVVLVGYHYAHAMRLARPAAAFAPTVVVPTAHPEGAFFVGRVRQLFEHADLVVGLSPEEAALNADVHGVAERVRYVPCPVDPVVVPPPGRVDEVVRAHGATRGRYLVVVGRVDPAKGSDDAVRFVDLYRRALDPGLELVVIGPGQLNESLAEGVRAVGFVDDDVRDALVAGSLALLQPSYMESFSYSLIEGWMLGRPALVQERSRVLAGHVARSGGGLGYGDYAGFEAALTTLASRPDLATSMAAGGARYAATEFAWPRVAAGFIEAMDEAVDRGGRRLRRTTSGAR